MPREIKLEWNGETYTIKENQAFGAAFEIEKHVTIFEIGEMLANISTVRFSHIARYYAVLLQYAGADVSEDEVHKSFIEHFHGVQIGPGDSKLDRVGKSVEKMKAATDALLSLMKVVMGDAPAGEEGADGGKSETSG